VIIIYFFGKQDRVILRPFAFIKVNAKECVTNSMGTFSNTNICYLDIDFTFIQKLHFIFYGLTALAALGLFIVEFSTSHAFRKTQSAGLV
jgi:hypothetical protein